ncbi:MAG TPA: hypothetical protein PKC79_13235, partial [Solidesulfovibrio magneticus]|nr:hypothetical protein [Solidesulfovibrio magneticus]
PGLFFKKPPNRKIRGLFLWLGDRKRNADGDKQGGGEAADADANKKADGDANSGADGACLLFCRTAGKRTFALE